jgi:acetyltransferase-like isoleucine patch superfamily enzyme
MNPLHLLVRGSAGVGSRARNTWFRLLGVQITGYVWLRRVSIPRQWSDITIEAGCGLDDGVVLLSSGPARADKLVIRSGTYVNRFTLLDAHEQIEVGANCMIGPHCYISDGDHGMAPDMPVGKQPMNTRPVVIEEGVWLGAGVIVLKGVTIGRNAVVGAGAVVTKDVAPNAIVAGVPARLVGNRQPAALE